MSSLSGSEKLSVFYHNIFNYPLDLGEIIKWQASESEVKKYKKLIDSVEVVKKGGNYFVWGNQNLIYSKFKNKRASKRKLAIAKKASKIIRMVPSVMFVGVTGSLAMNNANARSDIDLMIITKKGLLWTTRLVVYPLLAVCRLPLRSPHEKEEKDKLCMNIWMDESNLGWIKNRNLYTAHEIAQVVPLLNRNKTYEMFIHKNKWILDFWPNSAKVNIVEKPYSMVHTASFLFSFFEKLAYWIQKNYMKKKITRETITPTRALFHPTDISKDVLDRMNST